MLKFMVVEDQETGRFCPTVFLGAHQVWIGSSEATGEDAHDAGMEHLVPLFSALLDMGSNATPTFEDAIQYINGISPDWIKQQALEREEFGGKDFTENVLDIIKERLHAA